MVANSESKERGAISKKVLFLVLFLGIASALDLSDQNCDNSTGVWICQKPIVVNNASGLLKDNIACYSTDGSYPDLGCLAAIEIQKDCVVLDCKYIVTNDSIMNEPCEQRTLRKGDMFVSVVDPSLLDFSSCSSYQNESLYITECPLMGKEIEFGGLIEKSGADEMLFVTEMKINEFDLLKIIYENIVYIVLVAVIIIIAYWVFAPHKPMLKERRLLKERPVPTKRERRYGRRP